MMQQIGTKLYYCTLTGNVLQIIGEMQGHVIETTFEEDYQIYLELKERDINTIGLLKFEYGKYPIISEGSTGVSVDLETKELIFSYDELPIQPQEPTEIEILSNKISILEESQTGQDTEILNNMLATAEVFEMVLTIASSPETISLKNTKK